MSASVYEIVNEGEWIRVKFPYAPIVINELKRVIPFQFRKFDKNSNTWLIHRERVEELQYVLKKYFGEMERKCLVIVCRGETPSVYGIPMVTYGRDSFYPQRAWCFNVLTVVRYPPHGSRKYPEFHGVILAEVFKDRKIGIEPSDKVEVIEIPWENRLEIKDFIENELRKLENLDEVFEKLKQRINTLVITTTQVEEDKVSEIHRVETLVKTLRTTYRKIIVEVPEDKLDEVLTKLKELGLEPKVTQ